MEYLRDVVRPTRVFRGGYADVVAGGFAVVPSGARHASGGGYRPRVPGIHVDPATLRFLERHETIAHAGVGREIIDLGDALLLIDPADDEPFWNRAVSLRFRTIRTRSTAAWSSCWRCSRPAGGGRTSGRPRRGTSPPISSGGCSTPDSAIPVAAGSWSSPIRRARPAVTPTEADPGRDARDAASRARCRGRRAGRRDRPGRGVRHRSVPGRRHRRGRGGRAQRSRRDAVARAVDGARRVGEGDDVRRGELSRVDRDAAAVPGPRASGW